MLIGVSGHQHHPLFFCQVPALNLQTVQAPIFYTIPYVWVFHEPPPKNRIFKWTPKILKFSSLTPSYLLLLTEFLVKIS